MNFMRIHNKITLEFSIYFFISFGLKYANLIEKFSFAKNRRKYKNKSILRFSFIKKNWNKFRKTFISSKMLWQYFFF